MTMNIDIVGTIDNRKNQKWPPTIDATIVVNHPDHGNKLFLGIIYKYLWNVKACLVLLFNNLDYVESGLVDKGIVKSGAASGIMVLLPEYGWKYADVDKLMKQVNVTRIQYDEMVAKRKLEFEKSTILNDYPVTQLDLTTSGIFAQHARQTDDDAKPCADCNDNTPDDSLLNKHGAPQLDSAFDKHVNARLYDPSETFTELSPEIKLYIKSKLRLAERIPERETIIVVNKTVALKNIITTREDEINEGNKIINWLNTNMINVTTDDIRIFGDMKVAIHNGYVHIGRKGISVIDQVTRDNIGDLEYFTWQYNLPIDYDTLKYVLFQNDVQKELEHGLAQRKEAESILALENLIFIRPQPKYLMFTLKRIIMAWYSDDILTKYIRKIKVLINQWRAKSDELFNQQHGIMPMIVIYPRYGTHIARKCIERIADYFVLYNSIAWACSTPSYCKRITDLIYYTNGNLDLKMYYKVALNGYNGNVENASFDGKLRGVKDSQELMID